MIAADENKMTPGSNHILLARIRTLIIVVLLGLAISLGFGQSQTKVPQVILPVSTPEAEGTSSLGILKFLEAVEQGKNEIHSFVIVRNGKVISKGWWEPYARDLKHVMFSVSKSFTSTAVGLASAEKKLQLSDKVISFFPESLPDTSNGYMKEMTVEDLLMMSTGMNTDPLVTAWGTNDWPKKFISAPIENEPGSVFKYNNMASFMLSAIVQKATGEKLFNYLKPRLFEPLSITNVTWDETPDGYSIGAIGLRLLSEDMAKFGQLLLQKGKWNGKQIIPESWVEAATSFKIPSNDPGNKRPKDLNDWAQGYSYQFWRCRYNAYRADGGGGQFIVVIPDKNAVVVLTASAADTQEELNLIWEYLLPAMHDKPLPPDEKNAARLKQRIASLTTLKPTPSSRTIPTILSRISGKTIRFDANDAGIDGLTLTMKDSREAFVEIDKAGSGKHGFTAGQDKWIFSQTKLNALGAMPRFGGTTRHDPALLRKVASRYSLSDASTIELTAKFVEESISSEVWALHFDETGPDAPVRLEIKGQRPLVLEGRIIN